MGVEKVLVVDDEPGVRFGLRHFLESRHFCVQEAESCAEAEKAFRAFLPDVALIDYRLPDGNALQLLPLLKEIEPGVPVIVLTAHGSIDLAVQAIKEGAESFLTKPIELSALWVILERALENLRNRQLRLTGRRRRGRESLDPFVGTSDAIRNLQHEAARVLQSDSPVLILGETGAGKGVLARKLHDEGPRADEAFLDLNCAGLSREFVESELFGHEKGAFTGAHGAKPGLLELAHRGTVFLDEVGDVPPEVQPKVLKVIEEKRFRRLGDVRDRQVDVRFVSATHQDLGALIGSSRFRSDLFYRLSAIPLHVPPLRERREDIPILAALILRRIADDMGRGGTTLSPEAVETLTSHAWPGNIRELRNVLEHALLFGDGGEIRRRDLRLGSVSGGGNGAPGSRLTLNELVRQHIEIALREEGGNVEAAAKRLGLPRSSLYQKLGRFGIRARSSRRLHESHGGT